jgi:hypothetical protein
VQPDHTSGSSGTSPRRMHNVELSGGTYNRFLPVFVERSRVVPEPPASDVSMFKT